LPLNLTVTPSVAQRIADDGVWFVYQVSNGYSVFANAGNDVLSGVTQGTIKVCVLIDVDLRSYTTPAAAAAVLLIRIQTLKDDYDANYPGVTFRYGFKLVTGFGLYNNQLGPAVLPRLYGHPDDTPANVINADDYNGNGGQGFTVLSSADSTHCVVNNTGKTFANLFPAGWYEDQTLTVTSGARSGESTTIDTYTSGTGGFAFNTALTGALGVGDTFTVTRYRFTTSTEIGYFFFKNGIIETRTWMDTFVAAVVAGLGDLPDPSCFIQTTEDWLNGVAFYDAYSLGTSNYEYHLGDSRAEDSTYIVGTVNGVDYTLKDWDTALRSGFTATYNTYNRFSPQSGAAADYTHWTHTVALNRAYKLAMYDAIEAAWPDCRCGQYQMGNFMGTSTYPYYQQPGYGDVAGGNRADFSGIAMIDAYYAVLPGITPGPWSAVGRASADVESGTFGTGSTIGSLVLAGNTTITNAADTYWRNRQLWITNGDAVGQVGTIDTWVTSSNVAGLYRPISTAPASGDAYKLCTGVASFVGGEYLNSDIGWEVWPAWRDFYRVTSTPEGLFDAAGRWIESAVQAASDAFPDNRIGAFIYPGPGGEGGGLIPPEFSHPDRAIVCTDGWFTPTQWGEELLIRALRSGCNWFVVFNPSLNSMDDHATMINAFRARYRDHYWRDMLLQAGYDPNTAFDSTPSGAYTYTGSRPRDNSPYFIHRG
jgi:hypothetical protein